MILFRVLLIFKLEHLYLQINANQWEIRTTVYRENLTKGNLDEFSVKTFDELQHETLEHLQ